MITDRRAQTVEAAYDALGARFGEWTARIEGEPLDRFLDELVSRVDKGAQVLELGCGDGRTTERLAERFDVVGVDISSEQLRLAHAALPETTFMHADLMELDFPRSSFEAITAFYVFMHIPRDDHPELLRRIHLWLKPGGVFIAPMSTVGGPDRVESWLGVQMFFSGWDAETNESLVRAAGLEVLVAEIIGVREPESEYETAFLWVLARKPE
jgi:cyclopropane fatty-acyl-phospholipid synthase-like methyltransferase